MPVTDSNYLGLSESNCKLAFVHEYAVASVDNTGNAKLQK